MLPGGDGVGVSSGAFLRRGRRRGGRGGRSEISFRGERISIPEHECDFDDPCCARCHEGISKYGVYVGGEFKALWMCAHCPPGNQDDHSGDEVPPWSSLGIFASREEYPQEACTPPYDAHARMLEIVLHPCGPPAMFRKSVDAAPERDDGAVVEFLGFASSVEPALADQKQDCEYRSVGHEGRTHDEMRETLPQMITATESQCCDTPKEKLHPAKHGKGFPKEAVSEDYGPAETGLEGR